MEKIIFVYNKDNGFMNGIFDFFHKLMSPRTYNCSLCMITYNYLGMRSAWSTYLKSLPIACEFLHKDEARDLYPILQFDSFPVIYLKEGGEFKKIVTTEELDNSDLNDLIKKINGQIKHN